ncbi:chorismate mutase [Thermaurantiacus sp.]
MTRIRPELATAMHEVRAAVDAIDSELVALIAERMRFMDAAARIKLRREEVRDEVRKAEVIARVKALAASHGLAPELVETLWEQLVEASIAHEFAQWDRLRQPARRLG